MHIQKIQGKTSARNIISKYKVLFSLCVWKRGGLTGHYKKISVRQRSCQGWQETMGLTAGKQDQNLSCLTHTGWYLRGQVWLCHTHIWTSFIIPHCLKIKSKTHNKVRWGLLYYGHKLPYDSIHIPIQKKSAPQPFQICPVLCSFLFLHIFSLWFVCVSSQLTILQTCVHLIKPLWLLLRGFCYSPREHFLFRYFGTFLFW